MLICLLISMISSLVLCGHSWSDYIKNVSSLLLHYLSYSLFSHSIMSMYSVMYCDIIIVCVCVCVLNVTYINVAADDLSLRSVCYSLIMLIFFFSFLGCTLFLQLLLLILLSLPPTVLLFFIMCTSVSAVNQCLIKSLRLYWS